MAELEWRNGGKPVAALGYPQTDLGFLLRRAALIGFKSEFVAPTLEAMPDEAISSPDY
jgi:hypothetical protein